jgi:hypothetical protein
MANGQPTVGATTAWEEARRALQCAIWSEHGERVSGTDWVTKKPSENPPEGYSASTAAWDATLDEAIQTMRGWGYQIQNATIAQSGAVLGEALTRSVRLVFDNIQSNRPVGTPGRCNAGDGE